MRARNAAGFGPWSLESEPVVCKFKALKPRVRLHTNTNTNANKNTDTKADTDTNTNTNHVLQVKIAGPKELMTKEGDTVVLEADVPAEPACEEIR